MLMTWYGDERSVSCAYSDGGGMIWWMRMGRRLLNLLHTCHVGRKNCNWAILGHISHMCKHMLIFRRGNRRRGVSIEGGHLVSVREENDLKF